jgi:hypothetical protein
LVIVEILALKSHLYRSERVGCFFALQETKLGPTKTSKPLVERLSSKHPAQSASEKALKRVEDDF